MSGWWSGGSWIHCVERGWGAVSPSLCVACEPPRPRRGQTASRQDEREAGVTPGPSVTERSPPWAAAMACASDSPSPAPPGVAGAGGVATGEPLEDAALQRPRGCPAPSSRTVTTGRPVACDLRWTPTVTVVPAGVCLRALPRRLASTWCSRLLVPGDGDRLIAEVEEPAVVRRHDAGIAHGLEHHLRQVHLARAPAAAPRRDGPAGAGPRPARTSGTPRPRPCPSPASQRAPRPGTRHGGSARRTPGSWRAASAARARRRRRTGAPAARCGAARRGRSSTWPSSVLSAAPTWPTSVRSSVSSVGHPRGHRRSRPWRAGAPATSWAVPATSRSGRSWRRTTTVPRHRPPARRAR